MNENNNMNTDDELAARVDAMGAVAGALMELLRQQGQQYDNLSWTDMVSACAVACRGVASLAMAADPDLTLDEARMKMSRRFFEIMMLPPELVRTVKAPDGTAPQVVVVPVKKH